MVDLNKALIPVLSLVLSLLPASASGRPDTASDAPEGQAAGQQLSPEAQALIAELTSVAEEIQTEGESLQRLEKLGDLSLQLGDVGRAVLAYQKAIASFGGTEELFVKFARVLGLKGQENLTVDTLKLGLQSFPDSETLQLELGRQFIRMKKPYAAVANLKGLVEVHPDNREYRFYLADAYRLQEKFAEADALLDELIAEDPAYLQAKLMKGDILLSQGEHREGVRYLESVLEENPDSDLARKILVYGYQLFAYEESSGGRVSRAVQLIRDALKVDPDDTESMAALGSFLNELGEYADAEDAYLALMEKHPDYLKGYALYGKLLESLERPNEAAEVYKKGMQKSRELGDGNSLAGFRALLSGEQG